MNATVTIRKPLERVMALDMQLINGITREYDVRPCLTTSGMLLSRCRCTSAHGGDCFHRGLDGT
jgi:hypothetical protein